MRRTTEQLGIPPPYPRIPYLWEPRTGAAGERLVPEPERAQWLREPVVVEEKLDGANVSIWCDGGRLRVASRGGPGAMDRARQLGPLRARVATLHEPLAGFLADATALYAEWLWLTHSVSYDRLPDALVVLDLWHPERGFLGPAMRDERAGECGLTGPPRLFDGVLGSAEALVALLGVSRFGSGSMEGAVLRRGDGQVCKVVRPEFVRVPDDRIARVHNVVVGPSPG